MITGRPPFDGETPAVVMMKHLNETVPSPHDLDRSVSLPFCHLLEKMMAKDPNLRYQTPDELFKDIQRIKSGQAPLGTRPPVGKTSISRPERHRDSNPAAIVEAASEHKGRESGAAISAAAREPAAGATAKARGARGTQKYKPLPLPSMKNPRTGVQALFDAAQLPVVFIVVLAGLAAVFVYFLIKYFMPK